MSSLAGTFYRLLSHSHSDLLNSLVSAIIAQMNAPGLLATADAARWLDVDPSRVRALLIAGELQGFKVGERWLIDADSVRRRIGAGAAPGRLLEPANAWGALLLASGEDAPWLSPDARWRIRRLLDQQGVTGLAPRLRRRSVRAHYQAHPGILRRLAQASGVTLTGISAAAFHGLGLSAGNEIDAYVSHNDTDRLVNAHALEPAPAASANVSLRTVSGDRWRFSEHVAPVAVVALDLAEEPDTRSARTGRSALAHLDAQRPWRASLQDSRRRA